MKVFNNSEFGKVRTVTINNEPWFVGKDIAEALGYSNASKAVMVHVNEADKQMVNGKTHSHFGNELGQRGGWLINESGLYSLILGSHLPNAQKFQRWVTSEVLPSIRKHGAYMTEETLEQALTNPDFLIQLATELKQEKQKRLEAEQKNEVLAEQNEANKPKVLFADAVTASETSILIGELAKLIKQNGVDIGQKRLFAWMRKNNYLTLKNLPTQKAMNLDVFEVVERLIVMPDGSIITKTTTKVTGKGQVYFVNKFLKNKNIA